MKNFLIKIFLPLLVLIPGWASAGPMGKDNLSLNGTNAWDLYVMGNGHAVHQIMTGIVMLSQSSVFTTLLLVMATLGFFFLAIQAGFDPGKNLMKMFGFLLSTWAVILSLHSLKANIVINDPVTNTYEAVSDVPALIALPSSIISEVGHWMTDQIETAFSTISPSSTNLNMSSGGGYNLFGSMMQDATNFSITNPELKKSLSAYAGDCVISALARKTLSTSELMSSQNLWKTYQKAASSSSFTRYYSATPPGADGTSSVTCGDETVDFDNGMGGTATCAAAYACMTADLTAHAADLMTAKAAQWAATGTQVEWETRMQSALEIAGGGQNNSAGGQNTTGMILQTAMVNQMSGSFRDAAVQSGTNEILMSASVAQAEAQQKSAWVTGSLVFQHMMGYVYTVLQAFTFAMVPLIIIALMIPGMGKAIFINYAQLLVWLALWEPMLSIVNFLMMIFSQQTLGQTWMSSGGGLTMQTQYIVNEQTNNLVTTAQFMGTMVPLISWGLVKGSMAFTEFIAHGIGNSFASSAGAQAATGNMSMNNMSMNNMGNGKYNTSSQSTVGNSATNVFSNSGVGLTTADFGGGSGSQNGQGISNVHSSNAQSGVSQNITVANAKSENAGHSSDTRDGATVSHRQSDGTSSRVGTNMSETNTSGRQASDSHSLRSSDSHGQDSGRNVSGNESTVKSNNVRASTDASVKGGAGGGGAAPAGGAAAAGAPGGPAGAHAAVGAHGSAANSVAGGAVAAAAAPGAPAPGGTGKGGGPKFGSGAGVDASTSLNHSNGLSSTATQGVSSKHSNDAGHDISAGHNASSSISQGTSLGNDHSRGNDHSFSHDKGHSTSAQHSTGISHSETAQDSKSYTEGVSNVISMGQRFDVSDLNPYIAATEMGENAKFDAMISQSMAASDAAAGIASTTQEISSGSAAIDHSGVSTSPFGASSAGFGQSLNMGLLTSATGDIARGSAAIGVDNARTNSYARYAQGMMGNNVGSALPTDISSTSLGGVGGGSMVQGTNNADKFAGIVAGGAAAATVITSMGGSGGGKGSAAKKLLRH